MPVGLFLGQADVASVDVDSQSIAISLLHAPDVLSFVSANCSLGKQDMSVRMANVDLMLLCSIFDVLSPSLQKTQSKDNEDCNSLCRSVSFCVLIFIARQHTDVRY